MVSGNLLLYFLFFCKWWSNLLNAFAIVRQNEGQVLASGNLLLYFLFFLQMVIKLAKKRLQSSVKIVAMAFSSKNCLFCVVFWQVLSRKSKVLFVYCLKKRRA